MFNALLHVTKYVALFSGARFFPFNPIDMNLISRVDLEDIAHSLSNKCRFNGHCSEFYSVAQHCVHVAMLVHDERLRIPALLHDASEAYVGDVVSPLKRMFAGLLMLEGRVQKQINSRFGIMLSTDDELALKRADLIALATEKRDLMPKQRHEAWSYLRGIEPDPQPIIPLLPQQAKALFLDYFQAYAAFDRVKVA